MLPSTPYLLLRPANVVAAAAGGDAAQTTAFLARADASTLVGATERAAYKALINGLVTDGVFAKLDALYITATDTSAHSLLNLVSSSFNATIVGSPTFVADRGWTSTGTTSDYLDTNCNLFSFGGLYAQNSAHISAWSNTTGTDGVPVMGATAGGTNTALYPNFASSDTYIRINDSSASGQVATTAGLGWYMGSRTSSSNRDAYNNNTSLGNTPSATSAALSSGDMLLLKDITTNSTSRQMSQFSFGSALTSTDAANFYSRLRTYMTAVGVP